MEFGSVVGPKFSLCDGLGQSFGGLGWVEEIGLTDNSDQDQDRTTRPRLV